MPRPVVIVLGAFEKFRESLYTKHASELEVDDVAFRALVPDGALVKQEFVFGDLGKSGSRSGNG
jgi:hypothetical protein